MTILTAASRQWASRPADERYLSLTDMQRAMERRRSNSASRVISTRDLLLEPVDNHKGLVAGTSKGRAALTHWSFGQLAGLAGAPAGYLRSLPSEMAADCLNYGLRVSRDAEDIGVLLTRDDDDTVSMQAATGPRYGRIWNSQIVAALVNRFGDGVTGDFRVPGEFGQRVEITNRNTTLYAGDRDMFVFLADEEHRIEVPNRRNGEPGSLARGFFIWNSEVGSASFGVAMFLFDYVCMNRIVWGAQDVKTITLRHTASAPHRWVEEVAPQLIAYANSSARPVEAMIEATQKAKIDALDEFLAKRFTKAQANGLKAAHEAEEGRPVETLWDVATGATAYARGIEWQDERVKIERIAGDVLSLAL